MVNEGVRRVSVDIGGTFTDCFLVWDGHQSQGKALTSHHNLSTGFNQALAAACERLDVTASEVLSAASSVRYATTLGTNALIERKGPRVGLLITEGMESTVAISRGRGYAEGLTTLEAVDLTRATRPDPIVPPQHVRGVRQRLDYKGNRIRALDEQDLRLKIRDLVDLGIQALVVTTANGVVNDEDEQRIREIFLEDYPSSLLGGIPIILSSEVAQRRGEYMRTITAIIDAYLHSEMHYAITTLERNLRSLGYHKPVLLVHNTGGMGQPNSTDALRTVHSGPVAGINAGDELARSSRIGNIITTDMGGTSFDIGLVVEGGVKHYDFNPVIDRWLVNLPIVHLRTLGAGGGSVARYDETFDSVKVGPDSAGSDPGPACYDRGGMLPTVTDADLILGYLTAENYADGKIAINERRVYLAMEDLCDQLSLEPIELAKVIRRRADFDMAMGISSELRVRGYSVDNFTLVAFGGNGPLHCCGIAAAAKISRVLVPPFSAVFSASGASSLNQLHFHERAQLIDLYNSLTGAIYEDFDAFNTIVAELEEAGTEDLARQGVPPELIQHRLEIDLRYGAHNIETTIVPAKNRLSARIDVLKLIEQLAVDFGARFGEDSQAPETGVRVMTLRVASFVEDSALSFDDLSVDGIAPKSCQPIGTRQCHFPGVTGPLVTNVYDTAALERGVIVDGPAVVDGGNTTYLVEPGWQFQSIGGGAAWLTADAALTGTSSQSTTVLKAQGAFA